MIWTLILTCVIDDGLLTVVFSVTVSEALVPAPLSRGEPNGVKLVEFVSVIVVDSRLCGILTERFYPGIDID